MVNYNQQREVLSRALQQRCGIPSLDIETLLGIEDHPEIESWRNAIHTELDFGLLETPGTSGYPEDSSSASGTHKGLTSTTGLGTSLSTSSRTHLFSSTTDDSSSKSNDSSRLSSSFSDSSFTPRVARRPPGSSSTSSRLPGSSSTFRTPYSGPSSRTPGSRRTRTPYTTSSATPLFTPRVSESSTVVAIVEGRGLARGEVGMASLDLKKPELLLSQFSDMPTYIKTVTKLVILHPLEILLPNTACESGTMTNLSKIISLHFPSTSMTKVQRKYFNETKGLLCVRQLCVPEYNSVEMEVSNKYYCLAAAAALVKYIEFIQNTVYAPGSLKVVFKGSENTTMIDMSTVKNLELLQNQRDAKSDHTLYGILNYTKTAGGARLLRANILQPPSDLETIILRQAVVSELTEKPELFYSLQAVLTKFLDVEHLLSLCVQIPKQENIKTSESKITNIMYLKHTLELVAPLREVLGEAENPLLKASYKMLGDPRFTTILNQINSVIHEDARYQKGALSMRTQKCFAVKVGLLDLARRTYTEIVDDITDLVEQMAGTYSLPLKMGYSSSRGFHITMYSSSGDGLTQDSLPGVFIKVTKHKNTFSFTTADIIRMNDRTKESLHEVYTMASIVTTVLLNGIRDDVGCLYKLTDSVAMLDMLVAFAHACTISDFVKPEFTDTLAIKQGRHPILERIAVEPPVPNNIYASEDSNFVVITGPNMSGKSTYLRQIALLQIMAQIGSFVPAEYASLRLANQIFSRIGSDDDLETNSSTFVLEMKEINYIIQTASSDSLIIIDELGRGTSAEEGVGLCLAICEHLLGLKAFTFFVTHFLELACLDSLYPNVENYYFEIQRNFSTEANCEKVVYTHALSKGKTKEKHYGLQLAENSAMPRPVIQEARKLAEKIAEEKKNNQRSNQELVRERAMFKLATRLVQAARSSRLEEDSLRQYVISLKRRYDEDIAAAEE